MVESDLWDNVVLAGGLVTLNGFQERLQAELHKLRPTNRSLPLVHPQRKKDAYFDEVWYGGSVKAFDGCWLTAEEYQEVGTVAISSLFY